MTDLAHLSSLHAKIHDPGQRSFKDYCARADARAEFCRLVIEAWPRIAAVISKVDVLLCADGYYQAFEALRKAREALEGT